MNGLSVVVVSFETAALTLRCLDQVERALAEFCAQTGTGAQWILVDNGSTDETVESVRARFPDGCVVGLGQNLGFAAAANQGAQRATGDVLLFLNTDVELDAGAAVAVWSHLQAEPGCAIAAPRLLYPDGRRQNSAHVFPSLTAEFFPKGLLDAVVPARRRLRAGRSTETMDVQAVQGAALFVRRSVFEHFGGFSEAYFFYLEETDLCFRVARAGHRVVLVGDAAVVHQGGASSKRVHPAASRIEFHRSLYHFLAVRRGANRMRVAASVRTLRNMVTVLALALVAPFSQRGRRRLAERWALVRWHLVGCPETPSLAELGRAEAAFRVPG